MQVLRVEEVVGLREFMRILLIQLTGLCAGMYPSLRSAVVKGLNYSRGRKYIFMIFDYSLL